jgi:sucrose-6-phosphate hydrolase SacC (GH32 family)
LTCKDKTAPLKPEKGRIHLEILVDRTSIEIYANGGRVYMPMGATAPQGKRSVEVYAKGGAGRIVSLAVHKLRSIWSQ